MEEEVGKRKRKRKRSKRMRMRMKMRRMTREKRGMREGAY